MDDAGNNETLQKIELPAGWTFAALVAGLALGWALSSSSAAGPVLAVAGPVGTIWLRALQMTIIPLVAALLVAGIARMVATARAGAMARRTLLTIAGVLAAGALLAALAMPLLLEIFPIPGTAEAALMAIPEVRSALERGRKIEAIRHVREATGMGLKEAKQLVERNWRR